METASRPNIVFTVVDDWGFQLWPARDGSGGVRRLLPNVSQLLVDDGLTLLRHYAYKNCAPSRQALLSGRWPVNSNEHNSNCIGMPLQVATLADLMASGGYATHFLGKWHCGVATQAATPSRRGFSTSLGFFGKAIDHYTYCSADAERGCRTSVGWEGDGDGGEVLYDLFEGSHGVDCPMGAAHPLARQRRFSTDAFARRAVDLIERHDASGSAPLFLFVAFAAPHGPLQAPASHRQAALDARGGASFYDDGRCPWGSQAARCDGNSRHLYEALAVGVDDGLGRIAHALQAKRMWAETLLVFSSDNGGNIGVQGSNAPLRGGKNGMWEGGVRTVAAMGGGHLPAALRGRSSQVVMHVADWWETLAQLAGVPAADDHGAARPADSRSILPALSRLHAAMLLSRDGDGDGDGDGDLGESRSVPLSSKCLLEVAGGRLLKLLVGTHCECKVGSEPSPNRYCLQPCSDCGERGCLYDVLADPSEAHDLAASQPHALARLRRQLDAIQPWADADPRNARCQGSFEQDYAAAHGAVIQPFLDDAGRRLPLRAASQSSQAHQCLTPLSPPPSPPPPPQHSPPLAATTTAPTLSPSPTLPPPSPRLSPPSPPQPEMPLASSSPPPPPSPSPPPPSTKLPALTCGHDGYDLPVTVESPGRHGCLRDGVPFAFRGAVVCLQAKVASSSWKLVLLKSAHVSGFPDEAGRFDDSPHGRSLPSTVSQPSSAEWSRMLREEATPRYMIVREPFARLLSAYLDKIMGDDPLPTDLWPSGFRRRSDGFGAFVRAVVRERAGRLNRHFELQSRQCDAHWPSDGAAEAHHSQQGRVRYSSVLRLEDVQSWYPEMACRLGLEDAVSSGWSVRSAYNSGGVECFQTLGTCGCPPLQCHGEAADVQRVRCGSGAGGNASSASSATRDATQHVQGQHATSAASQLLRYYDAESARLVAAWARDDFEIFGYDSAALLDKLTPPSHPPPPTPTPSRPSTHPPHRPSQPPHSQPPTPSPSPPHPPPPPSSLQPAHLPAVPIGAPEPHLPTPLPPSSPPPRPSWPFSDRGERLPSAIEGGGSRAGGGVAVEAEATTGGDAGGLRVLVVAAGVLTLIMTLTCAAATLGLAGCGFPCARWRGCLRGSRVRAPGARSGARQASNASSTSATSTGARGIRARIDTLDESQETRVPARSESVRRYVELVEVNGVVEL